MCPMCPMYSYPFTNGPNPLIGERIRGHRAHGAHGARIAGPAPAPPGGPADGSPAGYHDRGRVQKDDPPSKGFPCKQNPQKRYLRCSLASSVGSGFAVAGRVAGARRGNCTAPTPIAFIAVGSDFARNTCRRLWSIKWLRLAKPAARFIGNSRHPGKSGATCWQVFERRNNHDRTDCGQSARLCRSGPPGG
jgi:hypothetical protein